MIKEKAPDYLFSTLTEFKLLDEMAGTFTGYGSNFGVVDDYGDMVVKGAYKRTLADWKKKGKLPKMLAQHGMGETGLPIGKWTSMTEDDTGLKVEGQLFPPETELLKLIRMGLKSGELDGLSIGYRAKDFSYGTQAGEPRRTLKGIDLFEVSLVTFPANTSSRISTVKASEIRTRRDFEKCLRESGMFSKNDAVKLASGWSPSLSDSATVTELLSTNPFK